MDAQTLTACQYSSVSQSFQLVFIDHNFQIFLRPSFTASHFYNSPILLLPQKSASPSTMSSIHFPTHAAPGKNKAHLRAWVCLHGVEHKQQKLHLIFLLRARKVIFLFCLIFAVSMQFPFILLMS